MAGIDPAPRFATIDTNDKGAASRRRPADVHASRAGPGATANYITVSIESSPDVPAACRNCDRDVATKCPFKYPRS